VQAAVSSGLGENTFEVRRPCPYRYSSPRASLHEPVLAYVISLYAANRPSRLAIYLRMPTAGSVRSEALTRASCCMQVTGPKGMLPAPADAFTQAVGTWYDEIHKYDYNAPGAGASVASRAWRHSVAAPRAVVTSDVMSGLHASCCGSLKPRLPRP